MRIAVHDFAGHAFQLELSRELARRGHSVFHIYPPNLPGPKGRADAPDAPALFHAAPLDLPNSFSKYSIGRRLVAHQQYANSLCGAIRESGCDVVLSGNTPIDIQYRLLRGCRRRSIPLLHWVQDIYCLAVENVLARRLGRFAKAFALPFAFLERRVSEASAGVILISDDFGTFLNSRSIRPRRSWVIENWTPLSEVVPLPQSNPWSREQGLAGSEVLLYSGTMGMKHDPGLIYALARGLAGRKGSVCAVVSEGLGRDYLEAMPPLDGLRLFDFQPYDRVSEVLATADVLVAVIEENASRFAVPSKVLSYLAAGRPVLLASPADNLAARIVRSAGAGIVTGPGDREGFVAAGLRLLDDRTLRQTLAANARSYAEKQFEIGPIAQRFEAAIREVTGRGRGDA
ncbi:MAG: glycosyltransferase family 4 protein [Gemmataceae bacterium]|nr:glycosyltransferase family 4 protein [Gemmataceae bacterium]